MYLDDGKLRLNEAQLRLARALDTEWLVLRRGLLNELRERVRQEFLQAAARGELLDVSDEVLRELARDALDGEQIRLLGAGHVQD